MGDVIDNSTADILAYIGIKGDDKINQTLENVTGKFSGLAEKLGMAGPIGMALAAAGTVIGAAASAAYAFDKNIQTLRGTLNADRGEIAKIGQDLLDISKVNPLRYEELAGGLKAIHDQGVPASEQTALLATAAEASTTGLGSMMDIITGGIDSYERYATYSGDLAKDQATLRDVYDRQFAIVGTGAINYKDLVEYTGRLLPIAQSLGLPMDQLYSAIATLNVNEANPAGLLMFLQSISKNREKWEGIGVQVFDPITGSINGLSTIAQQFAGLTQGKSKEEISDLYNFLGLNRMTGPLFDTLLSNMDQFKGYLDKIATSQGEMRDRSGEATDNFDAQWQMIKNNLNAELISLGSVALPPVVDLLKAINTSFKNEEIQGANPNAETWVDKTVKFTEYITAEGVVKKINDYSTSLSGTDGKGGAAKAINTVGDVAAGPTGSGGAAGKVNALNIKMSDWANMSPAQQVLAGIKDVAGALATNVEAAALHIGQMNTDIKPVGNDWRDYTENYKTLSGLIGTQDTGLVGGMRGLKDISVLAKQPMIDIGDATKGAGDKVYDAKENSFDLADAFGAIAKATGDEGLSKGLNLIGGLASSFAQGGVVGGTFAVFSTLVGSLMALGKDKDAVLTVDQVIDSLGELGETVKEIKDYKFDENQLFIDAFAYEQDQIDKLLNKGSKLTTFEKMWLNDLLSVMTPIKNAADSMDALQTYTDSADKTLELARKYQSTFGSAASQRSKDMMIIASQTLVNYIKTLAAGTPAYNQALYELAKLQAEMGNSAAGIGFFLGADAQSQVQSYIDMIQTFGDTAYDASTGIRSFNVEFDSMMKQLTGQYTQFEKDTKSVSETIKQLLYFRVDLDTTDLDEKIALSIQAMNAYLSTLNPESQAWQDAQKLIDELTQKFRDLGGVVEDIPAVEVGTTGQTPAYAEGGYVPNTGLALLHANEFVLTKEATASLGPMRLERLNSTGDLSSLGGARASQQTVVNIIAGNTTPDTWYKISDENIQPRIDQRTRKFQVKANPYAE